MKKSRFHTNNCLWNQCCNKLFFRRCVPIGKLIVSVSNAFKVSGVTKIHNVNSGYASCNKIWCFCNTALFYNYLFWKSFLIHIFTNFLLKTTHNQFASVLIFYYIIQIELIDNFTHSFIISVYEIFNSGFQPDVVS